MSAPAAKDVQAAGVVAFRPGHRVLLVHRPKSDDWSFPKGKVDPGEHPTAAAVRALPGGPTVFLRDLNGSIIRLVPQ